MENQVPILYNYFRSSASWRVRIALNIKKIKYEYKSIHLVKGDQKGEEFVKLNPMKHVPALVIDGHTLIESLPIIEYLEEKYPEPALFPKDSFKKAQVRAICELINSGIQPLQNLKVLAKIEKDYKGDKMEWIQTWVNSGFESLEKYLSNTKGVYCVGDTVTAADLFFAPQVISAEERFKIDLNLYPNIKQINENLKKIKDFEDALPKNQPDAE